MAKSFLRVPFCCCDASKENENGNGKNSNKWRLLIRRTSRGTNLSSDYAEQKKRESCNIGRSSLEEARSSNYSDLAEACGFFCGMADLEGRLVQLEKSIAKLGDVDKLTSSIKALESKFDELELQ